MRTEIGSVALLLGVMGCLTSVAASENAAGAAGKRGLSPIIQPDFIFKACTEVEHVTTAFSGVNPALGLASYLERKGRSTIDLANIKITLLQGTSHGELTPGKFAYTYDPEPDYIGKDSAVFMAEFEGKHYKIVVDIVVVEQVVENPLPEGQTPVCPSPQLIKVNGKPVSGSSGNDLNTIPVTFAALEGATNKDRPRFMSCTLSMVGWNK